MVLQVGQRSLTGCWGMGSTLCVCFHSVCSAKAEWSDLQFLESPERQDLFLMWLESTLELEFSGAGSAEAEGVVSRGDPEV